MNKGQTTARGRLSRAKSIYGLARAIEKLSLHEPCQEAARGIALRALDDMAKARGEIQDAAKKAKASRESACLG